MDLITVSLYRIYSIWVDHLTENNISRQWGSQLYFYSLATATFLSVRVSESFESETEMFLALLNHNISYFGSRLLDLNVRFATAKN
jgi:hypothetical protein